MVLKFKGGAAWLLLAGATVVTACAAPAGGGGGGGGGEDMGSESANDAALVDSGSSSGGSSGTGGTGGTGGPGGEGGTGGTPVVTPDAAVATPDAAVATPDAAVETPDAAACTPAPESCNGADDDCDGETDEEFGLGSACDVGVGACQAAGTVVCGANGDSTCDAMPGVPGEETCNGADDNCDGQTDEGFGVGEPCFAGVGACEAPGLTICGVEGTECDAQPFPATEEVCNGLDDDCDGEIDNGLECGFICMGDFDCGGGLVCVEGQCVPPPDPCLGVICPEGQVCADGNCGDGFPLGALNAYGHHGGCDSWNACNDARTCADAACAHFGYGAATRFLEGVCDPALGLDCNLFSALPGPLDDAWTNEGGNCNIPVAYDVHCGPPADGTVRLADGDAVSGRVEVYHNGQWGTVCDDGWDGNSPVGLAGADVICRQLGFTGALEADYEGGVEGAGVIWLDDVACTGMEASLVDCPRAAFGVHNCAHVEDIHVRCLLPGQCRDDAQCGVGNHCDPVEHVCVEGPPPVVETTLLVCGGSAFDLSSLFVPGDGLVRGDGCAPTPTTRVLVITRGGVGQFNPAEVQAFVQRGGVVVTEHSAANDAYNAVFDTGVADGNFTGNCQDNINPAVRFNEGDAFWGDNGGLPLQDPATSGCGMDMAAFPEMVRLGGWDANTVSLGYADSGAGRLWLVEADWQDGQMEFDASSRGLLYYMLTHGQSQRGMIGSFRVTDGPLWSTPGQVSYSCVEACAMLFGGTAADYGCSNVEGVLNHRAFADGWGDEQFCVGEGVADDFKAPVDGPYACGQPGCSYSAFVNDHNCVGVNYCWRGAAEANADCANNPLWMPVSCQIASWEWSSDNVNAQTEASAEAIHALYTGCTHSGDGNEDGLCSLSGQGYVSVDKWHIQGCGASWWHIGGQFTGQCGGHDGDVVRRLVTSANGCYDYRPLPPPGPGVEPLPPVLQ
jgi:hypothetical protein